MNLSEINTMCLTMGKKLLLGWHEIIHLVSDVGFSTEYRNKWAEKTVNTNAKTALCSLFITFPQIRTKVECENIKIISFYVMRLGGGSESYRVFKSSLIPSHLQGEIFISFVVL